MDTVCNGRFGVVPVTAEWLIDCTLDGRMLDTAQYQPPEATEQLLDLYPGLRTVRRPAQLAVSHYQYLVIHQSHT